MTDLDRYQYGYDQNSNRLWKANVVGTPVVSGGLDEYYSYDTLNRLTEMQRGTLNSGKTGITGTPSREMDYTLDPTGNWSVYLTKTAGTTDLNQIRSHSPVNEITAITSTPGWATPPGYDAAGNMNSFPQPATPSSAYTAVYDAWNRMVSVSAGGSTVAQYQYDGTDRRAVKLTYSGGTLSETRHFYYTSNSQDIEERVGISSSMDKQFVWGKRYIDEIVCRDDATPERLYATEDANFNVTALINTSGVVQQRFLYDPYGNSTILTASWGSTTDAFAWTPRFTGQFFDPESGIYYYRARYYQPQLGEFLSRDLLEYKDGPNLYSYVKSSPSNKTDPTGQQTSKDCCGPDITNNLLAMVADVQKQWNGLSYLQRLWLSALSITPYWALKAWDINNLVQKNVNNASCGNGTGKCAKTVTINASCYQQVAVNYWLAGLIFNALDSSWLFTGDARTFRIEVYENIGAKGVIGDPVIQKGEWFVAGQGANPFMIPPPAEFMNCTPCKKSVNALSWNWGFLSGAD